MAEKEKGKNAKSNAKDDIVVFSGVKDTACSECGEELCEKHSGRVGRTAAAKDFSPEAIRLAVAAHIRHVHTNYDTLLARYADRQMARAEIHDRVAAILGIWQQPSTG